MIRNRYFIVLLSFFALGSLFFLIQQKWIIFYKLKPLLHETKKQHVTKTLIFLWNNNQWIEKQIPIIHENTPETIYTALINAWITEHHDRGLLYQKTSVKHLFFNESHTECVINFSHNFLKKESTTQEHYMLIESLLKTCAAQKLSCKKILFLAQDQPLTNTFLDFSLPWPLEGFLD